MEQGALGYERESCCGRRRKLTGVSNASALQPHCAAIA
jgi:hypothetical protein